MEIDRKRLLWIDYVKGLCMMAIILNHIPGSAIMARMTYPYELVGFFFIGGVTFGLKERFGKFAVSKLKRLVVPVIAFGLINLALALFSKMLMSRNA